jgi:tetratricopeptide (TPR) repeat protein
MLPDPATVLMSPPQGHNAVGAQFFQEAVACFQALRVLRPELGSTLAMALYFTPRREEGQAFIRELQQERKDDPLLQIVGSFPLVDGGKMGDALQSLHQLTGNREMKDLGRIFEAQQALMKKDWDKAVGACREALRSSKTPQIRSMASIHLFMALYGKGSIAEAIKEYQEWAKTGPALPSLHVFLAQMSERAPDNQAAERHLRHGLVEDPGNPALVLYLVQFLGKLGREKEAREFRQELARARLPEDTGALVKVGAQAWTIQEYALAEKAMRKALASEPDNEVANVYLAASLIKLNRHQEAEDIAAKVIQLQPTGSRGYYLRGWSYYGRQRWAEAEPWLRQAVERKPEYHDHLLMLGDTLRRLAKYEEAESFLRKGLTLDGANALGHKHLSEALRGQGKVKEADEEARKAQSLQRPRDN